jgi:cyclase
MDNQQRRAQRVRVGFRVGLTFESEGSVENNFLVKQTSRREMLRAGMALAGSGVLAGLLPAKLLAAAPGEQSPFPQAGTPNDRVAQMRAQMASVPLVTTKLRDNIYLLSGPGGNMVALTGADGKVLVDSSFAPIVPKITAALDGMGGGPLKLLINTHWHFDHTDGNLGLHEAGALILAHENTRNNLSTPHDVAAFGLHFEAAPAGALPQQTFSDSTKVYFNGEELTLAHFAPAHTDSDIYVRYAKSNVLHMGDVWFGEAYPFFDASTGGNIDGMIAGTARGLSLVDADTKIVPGHGAVADKAALMRTHEMLQTVRGRVQKLKAEGKSLQEAVAAKPTADLDATWAKGMVNGEFFTTLVYSTL